MNQSDRSRRRFLGALGGAAAGLPLRVALGSGASLMGMNLAQAQSADYRALVCVFLYGGNDGHNMVPPYASSAHAQYSAVRQQLAIARQDIVPLDADIGLHPGMAALKDVWDDQRLAVINNVGPLARPMSQAEYFDWRNQDDISLVPESLFSHHEQQILWENATASADVRTGWGGRLTEAMGSNPVYSFNSNSRFGAGPLTQEMVIPRPGQQLGLQGFGNNQFADARLAALQALVSGQSTSVLHQRFAESQEAAFDVSAQLGPLLEQEPENGNPDSNNPEISNAFGNLDGVMDNYFAAQLYQVAKMISRRDVVGGNRHVYFVTLGGFDTHSDQMGPHAGLMETLGNGLAAFDAAMQALNLGQQVTLFTESDFGRTFKPNSSAGTDHAWGNMHLVMGGQVNGGQAFGDYPSMQLGGPDDAGERSWELHGRWIPQYSVDQYVATLAGWLAPEAVAQFGTVLPNLARFSETNLGFVGGSAQSG